MFVCVFRLVLSLGQGLKGCVPIGRPASRAAVVGFSLLPGYQPPGSLAGLRQKTDNVYWSLRVKTGPASSPPRLVRL